MNAAQLFKSLEESQRQKLADDLIRNNVTACQSSLVDMLIEKQVEGFAHDDIENSYYTDKEGAGYYLTNDCDVDEVIDYINEKHNRRIKNDLYTTSQIESVKGFVEICDDEELQDVCDHFKFYDLEKPQEIFEWWLVSDWFADKLRAINEPILSNDYGTWWGRTCTGQSISCDYNIQMLACEIEADLMNRVSKVKAVGL